MSGSLIQQLLAPGGGVILIPFIKIVIGCLLLTTVSTFAFGVARIHMAILSFLSAGLLVSLSFFEREYAKVQKYKAGNSVGDDTTPASNDSSSKTD